jgi:catechol 2,3-dioxygenase-like lactoylglutathione lyase family enzyme
VRSFPTLESDEASMSIGVSRVFHLNVNCRDLDRSLGFYRDLLGLTQQAHTVSPEQDGAAFGLPRVAWDAWILLDERGYDGVVVDLLEWQTPRPTGAPAVTANTLGFSRLGFTVADVDSAYERLREAGVRCFGEPHGVDLEGAPAIRAVSLLDPDGTMIELVGQPGVETRFSFLAVNCADLGRSVEFYESVLGFQPLARMSPGPQSGAALGLDGEIEFEMAYLDDPRRASAFALDLVQWKTPAATGQPSREANRVGPFRLAFMTDDIDRDHAALVDVGVHCWSPPTDLDMGPGMPDLRALLFDDPDGAVLELIESPN